MLPVSAKELVRFTPEQQDDGEPGVVYLIKPASVKERSRFEETLAANGVVNVSDRQFTDGMKQAVRALVEPDAVPAIIVLIEEAEHRTAKGEPFDDDLRRQMEEIEFEMAEAYPPFAKLRARRLRRLSMLPIIACQMFLKGVENLDIQLKFAGNMLTDDSLEQLDSDHLSLIGWKAVSLMFLGREQEKNSASLSPSVSSPTTSVEE
jgi:hypothetical protein